VFWVAFGLLAALAVLPLWVGEYLPLIDLPQHAAQLSIGERWHDPAFHYQEYFHVNWYTNQLVAYNVTRVFALMLPLLPAIKCVLSLSVIGLALAVHDMVRTLRGDPWWSLVAFPVGYSFSMYWGFFNFVVSLPLGIFLITLSTRYALEPTRKRALWLFLAPNALFFAHVLILAYAGLVSAALIAARAQGLRAKLLGWTALASVLPTVALWWTVIQGDAASTTETPVRAELGWYRLREFLNMQIGTDPNDAWAALVGALLLALPFVLGGRPARVPWRYVPFAITALVFAFVPQSAIEVDMIYGRFAVFAVPTLIFALESVRPTRLGRVIAVAALAAQLGSVAVRFKQFDDEARPLDRVLAAAEPGKRMLYLPIIPQSAFIRGEPYYHFGSWYQVKYGGLVDFSFAEFFPMWYRYRAEMIPGLPLEFDSHADNFNWREHDGRLYDYLLVRGPVLPRWFEGADVQVVTLAHEADWTLLATTPPAPHAARGPSKAGL
jgi:hypothetical protein